MADEGQSTSRRQLFTVAGAAAIGSGVSLAAAQHWPVTKAYADSLAVTEIVPGGTTSAAVQAAVNSVPANGAVRLLPNTTYVCDQVALPARNITILAEGATIQSPTASHPAFSQTSGHYRLSMIGGLFTGAGSGILYNIPVSDHQYYDVALSGVSFVLGSAASGANLTGVREATIRDCYFEGCTGVYLKGVVNPHIMGSQFKNCTIGVDCEGTGTSYDAGLFLSQATMLGCGYGVKLVAWDYFNVTESMIDYCYRPFYAERSTTGLLSESYLTVPVSKGGVTYPPVEMIGNDHVKVANCVIRNHTDLPSQNIGMKITGQPRTHILNCTIDYWQKYGIQFVGNCAGTHIFDNYVRSVNPTTGPAAIYGANNSSETTWTMIGNQFSDAPANLFSGAPRVNLGNVTGVG